MSRDRVIQLQECAEELGFETIEQALNAGYHEVQDLVDNTFTLEKVDEQEQAHEAWLKKRDSILKRLKRLDNSMKSMGIKNPIWKVVREAYDFIKEECHD